MSAVTVIDHDSGDLVLPENPANLPVERVVDACRMIYERRHEIVEQASVETASEALRRAMAIERYVSGQEQKREARRAARIIETAVGEALGPAQWGGDRRSDQVSQGKLETGISKKDASFFRAMAANRNLWWPQLEEKPLSRKQVMRIIAEANAPKYAGPGEATILHMPAAEFLEQVPPADLLLTDPPYSTDVDDISAFVDEWFDLAIQALKPSGRAFIFIGSYVEEWAAYCSRTLPDGWVWGVPHAWCYRNTIGPTPEFDFVRNWQTMLTLRGPDARPLESDRITDLLAGYIENAPDGRHETKLHRWQKPLPLIERLVKVSTQVGDTIIDPFAGSGTSLVAARESGRNAYGCDVDDEAVRTCLERGCREG